ncbi:hypothetical protein [Kribbella kalugense]|uniref:Resolvase-like protein n=1 Tax=Kribbella kalugense TaxID=2512221 RepID=A0A4R7ZUC8_9ACTN|nr:hypothetical protein [Kribbella kalugense]TDW21619.1 hypothetical protein EV650_0447 [Kribbella kalugense]
MFDHPLAYAYLCAYLLPCASEVNRTKERLNAFAAASGLELAATFVEDDARRPLAFERFFRAVVRDQVEVVLLPSLLHVMVLGSPGRIREYFEAATEARIVIIDQDVTNLVGEAIS